MFELDHLQARPTYNDDCSHSSSSSSQSDSEEETYTEHRTIHALGHKIHDEASLRDFQKKLYWMTYRKDFVGLRPYGGGGKFSGVTSTRGESQKIDASIEEYGGLRTDAGWGCMLRSAQMMLAQTVRVHFAANSLNGMDSLYKRDPLEEIRIATWFADFPNPDLVDSNAIAYQPHTSNGINDNHHWYSLHQMVAAGLGLGVLPGEWYGPTTACHVLRELNEYHYSYLDKRKVANADEKPMFRVHVATEGCIYLDAISNLMTSREPKYEESKNECESIDDPLCIPTQTASKKQEWDTSLLLLLPLRLGIHSIPTDTYGAPLSTFMQFSQSVGMLGGTPRHALWFYGSEDISLNQQETAREKVGGWYGLDPHVIQPATQGDLEEIIVHENTNEDGDSSKRYRWSVHLNESYLRSLHIGTVSHSNHESSIPLSKLDPTLALGFYFIDHYDFISFQKSLYILNSECKKYKLPSIVTVLEKSPNYEVDMSEIMKNMTFNRKSDIEDDMEGFSMKSEEEEEEDDDDEFVLV